MISAGIDIGAKTVKVVLVRNGDVLAKSLVPAGLDTVAATQQALDEALSSAGLSKDQVDRFTATGAGRKKCAITDQEITEVGAAARGIVHVFKSCRTVVDVGAEEGRTVRCNERG